MNATKRTFKVKPVHDDKKLIKARKKGLIPQISYPNWMINDSFRDDNYVFIGD